MSVPLLDVSDVLNDPLFQDQLIRHRSTISVDVNTGRSVLATTQEAFNGVITSDTGAQLARGADARTASGSIIIHTKASLSSGGEGVEPDIVEWAGRRYTITTVDDYSHYGGGFIAARASLQGSAP